MSQGTALLQTKQRSFPFCDPAGASQRWKAKNQGCHRGQGVGTSGSNTQVPLQVEGTVIEFLFFLQPAGLLAHPRAPQKCQHCLHHYQPWGRHRGSPCLHCYRSDTPHAPPPPPPLVGSNNPLGPMWPRASYPRPSSSSDKSGRREISKGDPEMINVGQLFPKVGKKIVGAPSRSEEGSCWNQKGLSRVISISPATHINMHHPLSHTHLDCTLEHTLPPPAQGCHMHRQAHGHRRARSPLDSCSSSHSFSTSSWSLPSESKALCLSFKPWVVGGKGQGSETKG